MQKAWAVLLVAALVAGCGGDSKPATGRPASISTSTSTSTLTGTITVSAAASLTDAFKKIGDDFQAANPSATVTFNFGSSSTLAMQIEQGAQADNFASADTANMDKLSSANLVDGRPGVFATN